MSPRIIGCLFISILAAGSAFVSVLSAGLGFLLAIIAYGFVGSLVLLLSAAAAAMVDGWRKSAGHPGHARARHSFGAATAHSG